jgi:hypothetical protein
MNRSTIALASVLALAGGSLLVAQDKPTPSAAAQSQDKHAEMKEHAHDHDTPIPGVDRKDPASVAKAVLEAYKAKDFKKLAALSSEDAGKVLNELAEQGEKHPRYASLFAGPRWDAVNAWDGKTLHIRYRSHGDHADGIVAFHKLGDEMAYLRLHQHDTAWEFEDVLKMPNATFEQLSTKPPAAHGEHKDHAH